MFLPLGLLKLFAACNESTNSGPIVLSKIGIGPPN